MQDVKLSWKALENWVAVRIPGKCYSNASSAKLLFSGYNFGAESDHIDGGYVRLN